MSQALSSVASSLLFQRALLGTFQEHNGTFIVEVSDGVSFDRVGTQSRSMMWFEGNRVHVEYGRVLVQEDCVWFQVGDDPSDIDCIFKFENDELESIIGGECGGQLWVRSQVRTLVPV